MVQVEHSTRLGSDHCVARERQLVVLLPLTGHRPVGAALDGVDAVDDQDLQVRDRVLRVARADRDAVSERGVVPLREQPLFVDARCLSLVETHLHVDVLARQLVRMIVSSSSSA